MTLLDLENCTMLSLSIGITVLYCTVLYCTALYYTVPLHCTLSHLTCSLTVLHCTLSHVTGATGNRHRCYRHEVQCEMGRTNGGNGEQSSSPLLLFYPIFCSSPSYIQPFHVLQCPVLSFPVLSCLVYRTVRHVVHFQLSPSSYSNALAFASLHLLSEQSNLTWHHLT
jgi:hypothetical protein